MHDYLRQLIKDIWDEDVDADLIIAANSAEDLNAAEELAKDMCEVQIFGLPSPGDPEFTFISEHKNFEAFKIVLDSAEDELEWE